MGSSRESPKLDTERMAPMKANYDCVVMGGGPAGSTAAALVAQAGYSTLLVEREAMPRFHVGESLMPETYWTFQRLGVLERMKNSDFVKKHSVQFVSASGKESQPFFFEDHDPGENSQTWQVERADFDKMLFDNAADKGADCFDQTRVLEALFDGEKSVGVRLQDQQGETREVAARVVVDATGQQALIANRLGLCERLPHLKKAAIWTYFEDARRDPDRNAGATIIFHTKSKEAWFWFIPLSRNVTSIGVVGDYEFLLKGRGTPEEVFAEELQNCVALSERLHEARQVDGFRVAKEFSYRTRQHAGDGWVLIGDAFGFIDPIYSSGVFFALKTGEMAADAIVEGFQTGDLSATQLGKWTNEFKQGAQWILKLVGAYYTNEFSFGQFMKSYPGHEGNLTDLLIGRIFHDDAGKIFDDMEMALRDACS